jgi:hypothetical protein
MSFARDVAEVRSKRRYARMKVLIGVDPHKASVAVGAIDEATGELYRACQLPAGPHRLESPRTLGETVPRASL